MMVKVILNSFLIRTGFEDKEGEMKVKIVRNLLNTANDKTKLYQGRINKQVRKIKYLNLGHLHNATNTAVVQLLNQTRQWLGNGMEVRFINVKNSFKRSVEQLGLKRLLRM